MWEVFGLYTTKKQKQVKNRLLVTITLIGIALVSIATMIYVDPSNFTTDVILAVVLFIAGTAIANSFTLAGLTTRIGSLENNVDHITEVMNLHVERINCERKKGAKLERI